MTRNYQSNTLGSTILKHNNHYKDVLEKLTLLRKSSTFSVVIPYYETPKTINECLDSVFTATKMFDKDTFEILVVDDGSMKHKAVSSIKREYKDKLTIVEIKENKGRFYSRNIGLAQAKGEIVFFIDSDIIIPNQLLQNHLSIHDRIKSNNKSCITLSLFNFLSLKEFVDSKQKRKLFEECNDFRKECAYQATWIGCEEDKTYIGNNYRIFSTTNNLNDWPTSGFLGPWILSNMVLGGLFAVDREEAVSVGGCSNMFGKYGFEETSLVTKLMAKYGSFIVPIERDIALHLDDGGSLLTRQEKDLLFQQTHDIYFNEYLNLSLNEAIERDKNHS